MRRTLALSMMLGLLLAFSATAAIAAPPFTPGDLREGAVYADGELFGTLILGPIEVTEETRHSFDLLYRIDGQQSVGEAAPGQGYNGGRWIQVKTEWLGDERPLLTSEADVLQAEADGLLYIEEEENWDTAFLCPLIPARGMGT